MPRIALLFTALCILGCAGGDHDTERSARINQLLTSTDLEGYSRAFEPRPFEFPRDHSAHPNFKTEWWYFTGNLSDSHDRPFGFQLTFFRFALASKDIADDSEWRTRQAWMAHMAITDVRSGRFISAERFSREALMLAGNSADPFRIWIEDWGASATGPESFPLRLRAGTIEASLDLNLAATKPPTGHGERGLDAKGPLPGNASYYYSMPRLAVFGELQIEGDRYDVDGSAWLDREWSTSALDSTLAGWDWLALELSDGRDLMLYRLRTSGGGSSPFSTGSLIAADGTVMALKPADFELEASTFWTSPATGVRYPVGWNVNLPRHGLQLEVLALIPNQEMNLAVRYWEGAVSARGSQASSTVTGRGYLELTGY